MRKPKNRIIGDCDVCGKTLYAFGNPFVVVPYQAIYKRLLCHTTDPKTDCFTQYHIKNETVQVNEISKK
jgi:hypothetical protein|tara:strand:+ start:2059 stop:2265 length:207 start_codon:yes stop_codon:yes gene_type:complete